MLNWTPYIESHQGMGSAEYSRCV